MDKEQYNQFDDFFREAAASEAGPSMPESAWQQMEARLDGEKKRRRFIIWWWWLGASLLLAGGLSFYVLRTGRQPGKEQFSAQVERQVSQPGPSSADPVEEMSKGEKLNESNKKQVTAGSASVIPQHSLVKDETVADNPNTLVPSSQKSLPSGLNTPKGRKSAETEKRPNSLFKQRPYNRPGLQHTAGKKTRKISRKAYQETDNLQKADDIASEPELKSEQAEAIANAIDTPPANNVPVPDDSLSHSKDIVTDSSHTASPDSLKAVVKAEPEKSDKKTKRYQHFYVFAGTAPEWTFVSGRGSGPIAISYGGGFGYAFNSRLAVQTGLFRSGKKYSAGEGDYQPKPGSYYDNPNIQIESVEANCAVWEIPLSMRYVFRKNSRSDFFAVASLQSAIMKRETYDYDYKRYGNPAYSSHTYRTNSFTLFSGFGIAAGYERILNKQFSLLAMPYFNFPLKGIGEGRINLHSYGLQLGLKYNLPF